MKFDVIIIGGGAAGISAALWCDDLQLKTLLVEAGAQLGGQLLHVYNPIKNHLGIETENGRELLDVFVEQIEKRKFEIRSGARVEQIDLENKSIALAGGERFFASKIIVAAGVRRRRLNVEGAEKFVGKGILESGRRDADAVKDQTVCVVGGGDAAFENALLLAKTAAKVLLVHRRREFSARAEFIEQAKNHRKIEIFTETVLQRIVGDERIEAIELENTNTKKKYAAVVQAVLFRLGVEPNTEFLPNEIALDENGYIKINVNCETNVKGIFAVGDVANPLAPTVSGAVGMGATAVKTILAG